MPTFMFPVCDLSKPSILFPKLPKNLIPLCKAYQLLAGIAKPHSYLRCKNPYVDQVRFNEWAIIACEDMNQ